MKPDDSSELDALERLLGVVSLLNSDLDLASVLRRMSDAARELLGGDGAGVVVSRGDQLEVLALTVAERDVEGVFIAYEGSAVEALDRAGGNTLVLQLADHPVIDRLVNRTGLGIRTMAVTRLVRGGESKGALAVFFTEAHREVNALEQRLLEIFAGHTGAAIANAEAYAAVLRQSRHELAIIDAMADGLAIVDATGVVRWWNAAATQVTGLPAALVLGYPLPFPHGPVGVGFEHQLDNGSWIELLCSPLPEQDPPETVVTFRDISAAKMLEEAKNLFLATSGHELRTPLTVIRGFAATLTSRWDDLTEDERREAVRIIGARADGLGVLVERVLQSSPAEVGTRQLERRSLELFPIVQAAAVDVRSLSDRHTVVVVAAGALPAVRADVQAVRTILGHVVDNAVKYSPDGGVITLSVQVSDDGRSVCICVEDEGIGVDGADQERVFERFFQADGGDTRQRGGFGLGLYIVRRLVQAHDGTVVLVRRPDGAPGSRVEVRLPVDAI